MNKTVIALSIEAIILSAMLLLAWSVTGYSDWFYGQSPNEAVNHITNTDQYGMLAESLLHGRLDLDLEVSNGLLHIDNPYDYETRELLGAYGVKIYWDHAYFNGHYYSYFGVIPAIVFFIPYQLLTGEMLNTSYACIFIAILVVIAEAIFIYTLIKRFFKQHIRTFIYCMSFMVLFFTSNILYLICLPRFYSIPLLSSLLFTFIGLSFWFACSEQKQPAHTRKSLSKSMLFFGSFFMALNLGCRPQFMLACFLAFPIFWREIKDQRLLFSKSSIGTTTLSLLPFFLISIPLFAYNYFRFGSIFDFGSNYNLTGFDMTTYSQAPLTTLYIVFQYLLQPMHFESTFPFIESVTNEWPLGLSNGNPIPKIINLIPVAILLIYAVFCAIRFLVKTKMLKRIIFFVVLALVLMPLLFNTISIFNNHTESIFSAIKDEMLAFAPKEPYYGGLLWFWPLLLIALWARNAFSKTKKFSSDLRAIALCCLVFAAIVLIIDTKIAGLTQRYCTDFGWYLGLICILTLCCIDEEAGSEELSDHKTLLNSNISTVIISPKTKIMIAMALIIVTAIFAILWFYAPGRYDSIAAVLPDLWASWI